MQAGLQIMLIVEAIGVAQVTPTLLQLQMPRGSKTCHT